MDDMMIHEWIRLSFLPEYGRKDDENGEYFQTSDEHEDGAKPFNIVRKFRPTHGRTYLKTQRWAYITDATENDGDGVCVVYARGDEKKRGDKAYHQVDSEECQ